MLKITFSALIFSALTLTQAHAGECAISVTRYACPGMEKESYSKCGGQQSCDTKHAANTAAACAALALKACENSRFDITKYKLIRAKFNGANVANGIDFCDKDSGAYRVRDHFPFRNSAQCR